MKNQKALIIIDVQIDFCPGGTLAVPEGDAVVKVLNAYLKLFTKKNKPVFASRDWHPKKTRHFKEFGGIWPEHCVQRTKGARFHPGLFLPKHTRIVSKGMDSGSDGYSAFEAFDNRKKALGQLLDELRISELYIAGLATDYCVKETVLEALERGFKVKLLVDACRGVDAADSHKAIEDMREAGAEKATYETVRRELSRE